MFKMGKLKSRDYYTDTEEMMNGTRSKLSFADYLEKNNATDELRKARFGGKLAERLNLEEYTKVKYNLLYDGYNPTTKQKLIKTAGTKQHKPGVDLLLTMPKSISILYAVADEETKAKIMKHINSTLDKVMGEMAKDILPSNKSAKYRNIQSYKTEILYTEFTHFENRNLDPHIHKHITLNNLGNFTDENGKTKLMAIDTKQLMEKQKYYTSIYETLLLSALEQDKIYCERDEDNIHSFKVKSISDELCDISSTRRDELIEWAKKQNISYSSIEDLQMKNDQAIEDRRSRTAGAKQELTYSALMRKFKEDYKDKISQQEIDDKNTSRELESIRQSLNKAFVKEFNEKTIELKGHFELHELDTAIINHLKFTQHFNSIEEIQARVEPLRKEILTSLQAVYDKANDTYTTKSIIKTERAIADLVKKLESKQITYTREQKQEIASNTKNVELSIQSSSRKLTAGQSRAIDLITQSHDKAIVNVIGSAGVGKTSAIILRNTEIYKDTYNVYGLSTQGLTAQALIEAKIENRANIQQFLSDYKKGNIDFSKPPMLVVDESGMVGATHMRQLLDIVDKHNGKIMLVGDHKQLTSVSYGMTLREITKTLDRKLTVEVNDNVRQQQGTTSAKISEGFRDRKARETIELMTKNNLVKTATSDHQLREQLVNDYFDDLTKFSKQENKPIIECIAKFSVLSSTNVNVNAMNDLIRNRLVEMGEIGTEQQLVFVQPATGQRRQYRAFATNDSIMIKQKMKLKNGELQNGTTATIKAINNDTMLIQASDGKEYELDLAKNYQFNHSYSYTTHKSQGATMRNTYIYSNGSTNANSAYVDFSRHTAEVKLYIEDGNLDDFIKSAQQEVDKYTTLNNPELEKQLQEHESDISFIGHGIAKEQEQVFTIDIQPEQHISDIPATKEEIVRAKALELSSNIERQLAKSIKNSSKSRRII